MTLPFKIKHVSNNITKKFSFVKFNSSFVNLKMQVSIPQK